MIWERDDKIPKLALYSLSVGYNGRALISDISLSLRPGEILTLIGPNGSGKTTILKSISRHLAAIAGTVYLDRVPMGVMGAGEVARKMAVVFTDRVRPDLMTCREFAASGRYPYTGVLGLLSPRDWDIVDAALEKVHALDIAHCDFSSISDGQRQRVLLARALCQQPEIIVLDEPTSFLDIRHKIELLEILHDMAVREKITVVMSLHEIDLALKISDKIVCVKGERIAGFGTPEEIFTDETVSSLYDLQRGSYNALLGSVELQPPEGAVRCFVVGGNGCGIPYYRVLQRCQVPFAAGILAENDLDYAVAKPLAREIVSCTPYMPFGKEEEDRAKAILRRVEAVIDCGCPVGVVNAANARLLSYAASLGKRILTSTKEVLRYGAEV